jgi:hypothetical protein
MSLLIVYLTLMITGDIAAYLIGWSCAPSRELASLPGDVFRVSMGRLDPCGADHSPAGAAPIGPAPRRFGSRDGRKAGRHQAGTWCGKKTY